MSETPTSPEGSGYEEVGPSEVVEFQAVAMSLLKRPETHAEITEQINERIQLEDGQEGFLPTEDDLHRWTEEHVLPDGTSVYVSAPEPGFEAFEMPELSNLIEITVLGVPVDNPDGTRTYPEEKYTLGLYLDDPELTYSDDTYLRDAEGEFISKLPSELSPMEKVDVLIASMNLADQLGTHKLTKSKFRELMVLLASIKS